MVRELLERYKARIIDGIPEANLVGYYPALHGLGPKLIDRSIYTNHGTIYNGPTWKRLPSGLYVLNFDGTDDYVSLTGFVSAATTYTVIIWTKGSLTGDASQYLLDIQSGRLVFIWNLNGSVRLYDGAYRIFGTKLRDANFHQLAFVLNGTTSLASCYVDNTQLGVDTAFTPRAIGGAVHLGSRYSHTSDWFKGLIRLGPIYNSALSAAERLQLYTRDKRLFSA